VIQGAFNGSLPTFPGGRAGVVQALAGGGSAVALPETIRLPLGGAGQPLPVAVQRRMESLFSADFSAVRVHVGREALAVQAMAFTHGSNLYFAPGRYDPVSPGGLRLLAHELTHVVQQRAGRVRNPFGSGVALVRDPALEAEADRMGLKVVQQRPAPAAVPSHAALQRRAAPHGPRRPGVVQPGGMTDEDIEMAGDALASLIAPVMDLFWSAAPDIPAEQDRYPNGIDPVLWKALTGGVTYSLRVGGVQGLVNHLFQRFINYGFKYHINKGGVHRVLGSGGGKEGNCMAYTWAFLTVLDACGVRAEERAVRTDQQGRFIVKVDNFIDPAVKGHLFLNNVLQKGYYMFTNHAAVWVPALGRFYDAMARSSYASLAPAIECELEPGDEQNTFVTKARPKILAGGKHFRVTLTEEQGPGGFYRANLALLE